jgi:hypothetical protein
VNEFLSILMMALHILCAAALVGGALAWRFGALPGIHLLEPSTRVKVDNAIAAAWRPTALVALAGMLISGIYNLLHESPRSPRFHMVFGIKMLLVLHVLAVTVLATRPDNVRRSRQLTGIVISGTVIVILSVVLRWV